ncbi:hypothetical protein [Vibrio coralliirubri]|uniref:hypothetical protein n=1 Tax=Vibrio coralliirubri TaxID=1516159 RepID=UPI0013C40558|nr:hypothetical protein [Vibrio coralliirubri]
MMQSVLFTLDYELFGDGTGNVTREQINPTYELIEVLEQHGAKITVFFEYGQYMAYEKEAIVNPELAKDNLLIREQLLDLANRGHDIQLHIHPTWLNYTYGSTGFDLSINDFDITDLEFDDIVAILLKGKAFLEDLLTPSNPSYKCIAFRAGAWSASNNEKYIRALIETGFYVDSTVVKGAYLNSSYGNFDFRKHPSDEYWYCSKLSLLEKSPIGNLLQLPIYSLKGYRHNHIYFNKKRKLVERQVKGFYKVKATDKNLSFIDKLMRVVSRDYVMADFNFVNSDNLIRMFNYQRKNNSSNSLDIPFVTIGHSKTSYQNIELEKFIKFVKNNESARFETISEFHGRISNASRIKKNSQ